MNYKNFYRQTGNLLYAIAAVDGNVRPAEIEKVKQVITSKLSPLEKSTDEFGTDAAYIAEFQFDFCCENAKEPKEAYEEFINWFRENSMNVTEGYRDLLFRLAAGVAASFNGFNKAELVFLENLKRDLSFDKVVRES